MLALAIRRLEDIFQGDDDICGVWGIDRALEVQDLALPIAPHEVVQLAIAMQQPCVTWLKRESLQPCKPSAEPLRQGAFFCGQRVTGGAYHVVAQIFCTVVNPVDNTIVEE